MLQAHDNAIIWLYQALMVQTICESLWWMVHLCFRKYSRTGKCVISIMLSRVMLFRHLPVWSLCSSCIKHQSSSSSIKPEASLKYRESEIKKYRNRKFVISIMLSRLMLFLISLVGHLAQATSSIKTQAQASSQRQV